MGIDWICLHFSSRQHLVMPGPFVEEAFFPLYNCCFFVKIRCSKEYRLIRVFKLIPLIYMSILMPIPNCFYYYSSIPEPEVRNGDATRSLFISNRIVLAILVWYFFVVVYFPYQLEYCSFKVSEELCWDFDGDCIESVDFF